MGTDLDRLSPALSDRYRIESDIDSGGMATVYRARDLKHDRTVAIKVLRPDLTEAIGADRFLREIRTTANLSHPHILPLHDSGETGGLLYYVMPFVEGESLADRLEREGQLPVEDAIQIAREVADALAYAHRKGVVHRDIKPANIMLEEGHALLADFGIAQARASADETRLTGMGMSPGTPAYMSPEQITGEGAVDGRADQYALGCVLYEMLAGHPPFTGADVQIVMRQHLAAEAPGVTKARALVPAGVSKAVHRAMAKAPADRFRNVEEFEKALAGSILPLLARIPARRARALAYGTVIVLVLAVAGVVSTLLSPRADDSEDLDPNLVAVEPFENHTGDPAMDAFGAIVAEHIANRLGQTAVAEPVPVSDVRFALAAAVPGQFPVDVLSNELGAGTVVTGSLYERGDSLVIQAECRDTRRNRNLFRIDPAVGAIEDPQAVIQNLAARVSGLLAQHLDPDFIRMAPEDHGLDRPPLSVEVWEEYRTALDLYGETQHNAEPQVHFLRAFEMDSTFMAAGLEAFAGFTSQGLFLQADSIRAILEPSRDLMSPAQELEFDFLVKFWELDFEEALRLARRASEKVPMRMAYWTGWAASTLNYQDEAVRAFQRWERSPGEFLEAYVGWNPGYFQSYSGALHGLGLHERELEIVLEGKRRFGGFLSEEIRARAALGQIEAADSLIHLLQDQGDPKAVRMAAGELTAHGHGEKAREVLERDLHRIETEGLRRLVRIFTLHWLGRDQEAHTLLEEIHPMESVNYQAIAVLGITATLTGDSAQALQVDQRLAQWPDSLLTGFSKLLVPYYRATLHAAMGHGEETVRLAEQAIRVGYPWGFGFRAEFHIDVDLMRLRGNPAFEEFMRPKT